MGADERWPLSSGSVVMSQWSGFSALDKPSRLADNAG
jgi:hypothetical protein